MALSTEHKAALEEGRRQSRTVDAYLHKVNENKPKRGRKRTPDSIRARLAKIDESLKDASLLRALALHSEKESLQAELQLLEGDDDGQSLEEAEAAFVEVAKEYSERKNISYAAWLEAGVTPAVLRKANITR